MTKRELVRLWEAFTDDIELVIALPDGRRVAAATGHYETWATGEGVLVLSPHRSVLVTTDGTNEGVR